MAWLLPFTPSFCITLDIWFLTVLDVISNFSAIISVSYCFTKSSNIWRSLGVRKLLLLVDNEIQKIDFSSLTREQAEEISRKYYDAFMENMSKANFATDDNKAFSKIKMDTMSSILSKFGKYVSTSSNALNTFVI